MDCDGCREDMLDVLYGEADEAGQRRFDSHQAGCAECRRELAGLRRLRGELGRWRLPEPVAPPRVRAPRRRLPVGLAAAAALVLALGGALGLSGAEVRYDRDGFALRLGRGAAAAAADQERRHREEMAALRAEVEALRSGQEARVLRVVEDRIRQSESRQEEAREASLRAHLEEAEAQRQYDLARVSAGLAYLDGKTGLHAARTTELVGHLLQASQER